MSERQEKLLRFTLPVGARVAGMIHQGGGVFIGTPAPASGREWDRMPLIIEATIPDGPLPSVRLLCEVIDPPEGRFSRVVFFSSVSDGDGVPDLQDMVRALGLSREEFNARAFVNVMKSGSAS